MRGLALLLCLGFATSAGAVDVSQLSDVENDPCVLALIDRNTAQHVDAPDSALADACERAHGNVEVGWDFVLRTWKPPDVSATAGRVAGAGALGLALLGMLLAYGVLGWPVRALAPEARSGRMAETVLSLLLRMLLAAVFLALLTLPVLPLLAALAVAGGAAAALRRVPRPGVARPPASVLAETVAGAVNDAAASAPAVLAVALFAGGSWGVAAFGVALALPFSLPVSVRLWRGLRRQVVPMLALGGVLALVAGLAALDPARPGSVSAFAAPLTTLVPLFLAAVVVWRGGAGRLHGLRPRLRLRRQREPEVPGA